MPSHEQFLLMVLDYITHIYYLKNLVRTKTLTKNIYKNNLNITDNYV